MKEFLLKLKAAKEAEISNTRDLIKKSDNADEVRALGETLDKLVAELKELEGKIAESDVPAEEGRSFNPKATYGLKKTTNDMEYRTAFMNYVQKGETSDLLKRAAGTGTASDLGVLLPETIVNEIIKGVEKVYGQLYTRVKKTNLKGGIKYPLGAFSATFNWISEDGVSENQNGGKITGYVEFTYHIGEVRIATTLLQSVMGVEIFERELANILIEAYVKEMDRCILHGEGTNSAKGILTDIDRIPSTNVITFTEAEMEDWKTWQKKLFARIPLSMRGLNPEFVMNAVTYESNILTLEDSNGQPVAREVYNPVNGAEVAKFRGRDVVFVEDDMLKGFEDASADEVFGIYWVPEKAYAINTNLQFGVKRYFDDNTNKWISKGLVIADGKILDPKYIYILKKAA